MLLGGQARIDGQFACASRLTLHGAHVGHGVFVVALVVGMRVCHRGDLGCTDRGEAYTRIGVWSNNRVDRTIVVAVYGRSI